MESDLVDGLGAGLESEALDSDFGAGLVEGLAEVVREQSAFAATLTGDDFVDIVERVPIVITPNPENAAYLQAKRDKLGHLLPEEEST